MSTALVIAAACLILILMIGAPPGGPLQSSRDAQLAFEPTAGSDYKRIRIDTGGADRPFDLGAADIDRDGDLDIYGANHNRRSPLLLNNGNGDLRERLYQRGLAQQSLFPGFEDGLGPVDFTDPGLYVYAQSTDRIVFSAVGGTVPITGYLRAPEDFFVGGADRGKGKGRKGQKGRKGRDREPDPDEASVEQVREAGDSRYRRLEFQLPPGTELEANPRFFELPIEVVVDNIDPGAIFLGPERVNPAKPRFTLTYRDRHAYTWAQLGGDSRPDALIVRGGIKGQIDKIPDLISDELLVADGDGYTEVARQAGLEKNGCRGRGIRPADLGSDGDVDLLIECEEAEPLLFEQVKRGRFADRSSALAGIGAADKSVHWVAMKRGGTPQLMVAGEDSFDFFSITAKRTRELESVPGQGIVKSIAAADFDGDGDQDILASSEQASTVLRNTGGGYKAIPAAELGLPERGITAAWVDADNDGLLDLHDYQQGFFMQNAEGRFERAGSMAIGSPEERPIVARAIWFDSDSDGDRDLAVAEHFGGNRDESRYLAYKKRGRPDNHWLELELEGRGMGIDALGASVQLQAGPASRTAWVGESDNSRYSWGDTRLYFGLGGRSRVGQLTVRWPGGERTILRDLRADRLLVLRRGSGELERLELRSIAFELGRMGGLAAAPLGSWTLLASEAD